MYPVSPWSPDSELTPQQILARRTYQELINGPDLSQDAELERLSDLLDDAYEGADEALMDRLEEQLAERETALIDAFRQQLRARGDQDVDVALIDLYADMPQYEVTPPAGEAESLAKAEEFQRRLKAWQLEIGDRLGQLPLVEGEPTAGAQRFSCTGAARLEGRQLHFDRLAFYHIYDGPQALVDWLHHQGCSEFHYGFQGFED
jgi:hypothetical protein